MRFDLVDKPALYRFSIIVSQKRFTTNYTKNEVPWFTKTISYRNIVRKFRFRDEPSKDGQPWNVTDSKDTHRKFVASVYKSHSLYSFLMSAFSKTITQRDSVWWGSVLYCMCCVHFLIWASSLSRRFYSSVLYQLELNSVYRWILVPTVMIVLSFFIECFFSWVLWNYYQEHYTRLKLLAFYSVDDTS